MKIWYPHMWRYDILAGEDIDDFTDIKFVSKIVITFVVVSSKHVRAFLKSLWHSSAIFGDLRKFSEIFGKWTGTFVWPSRFWKIFGSLWKVVGNLRSEWHAWKTQCACVSSLLPCIFAIEIIRDNKLDSGREIQKSKLHTQKISLEFHEHKV